MQNTQLKLQFESNKQWKVAPQFERYDAEVSIYQKFINSDVLDGFCITKSSQEQPPRSDTFYQGYMENNFSTKRWKF